MKRHELVEDCLVVGLPDERFGERVVAVMSCAMAPASARMMSLKCYGGTSGGLQTAKQILLGSGAARKWQGRL